jgi:hypothetical protein
MDKIDDILAAAKKLKPPRGVMGPLAPILWERAVGTRIAKRTSPQRIDRHILYVRTATAAWANELTMLSENIIGSLAEQGVKVKALRFQVGQVDNPVRPERPPRHAPPKNPPLPERLAEHIARLDADDLSAAIGEAAALSLAAQAVAPRED